MRRWIVCLVMLVAPLSASAVGWVECNDSSSSATIVLTRFHALCFEWTATGDSTLIAAANCDTIEIGPLLPSMTDTTTGATAYVYRCGRGTPGSAAGSGACQKMLVDTDGDGLPDDVAMDGVTTGRKGQQYQTATLLYVSPQAATSGKTARLMITCH